MEHLWDAITAAVGAAVGFVFWMFKKHSLRIDNIEKRLIEAEKLTAVSGAVIASQMQSIKEDIGEIKHNIRTLIENKFE